MPVKRLRQIVTVLIVTAYIGATTLQLTPAHAANVDMNHAAMSGMMQDQDHPGENMPCKGMLPGCVTDLGCIFFVSLPVPDLTLLTLTAWSLCKDLEDGRVSYLVYMPSVRKFFVEDLHRFEWYRDQGRRDVRAV
jgi:hypothetical protein